MKKRIIWLSMVLALALAASASYGEALTPTEVLALDQEAKTLTVDDHVYELVIGGDELPLRFEKDGDAIILFAKTTEGEIEVRIGTDENEEVLRFMVEAILVGFADINIAAYGEMESLPPAEKEPVALCPQCQEPQGFGDHSRLACGHYRCLAGNNHPVVCKYCDAYACNGEDHSAVCMTCGDHICGKDHYNRCVLKKAEPKGSAKSKDTKKEEGYPGQGQAGPIDTENGTWYKPMYFFFNAPNASFDRAYERQVLKAEINKILTKMELMAGGEKFGQTTLEDLRKELNDLYAKLDALNN